MGKRVLLCVIVFFVGLPIFCQSSVWAESDTVPTLGPAESDIYPPAGKKDLLFLFYRFEHMYWKRQRGDVSSGKGWEEMGDKFAQELGLAPKDDMYERWSLYARQNDIGLNLYLRAALLMGESYLFASQAYFIENNPRFRGFYERGIVILEQIIVAVDNLAPDYDGERTGVNYLPAYSRPIKDRVKGTIGFLPYAGFETIGTGFQESVGVISRKVTFDINTYHDLETYRKVLPSADKITQIGTTQAARMLLSDFCPWGVEMYFAFKQAGFTEGLDFRILRPFSLDATPGYARPGLTVLTELYNAYESMFSNNPVYASYKLPPKISDTPLHAVEVPVRISRVMERIVGVELASNDDKVHRQVEGNLRGLRDEPIRWFWVGNPSYNLWFLSPRVYDWDETDWLKFWFTAVKLWYGGPLGLIADEAVTSFKNFIDTHYADGPTDIKPLTSLVVENYDKGVLLPSIYTEGQYLDPTAVVRKIAGSVLGYFVDQARQDNFGNINPQKLSMGYTYDGHKMPPVVIRSSVIGFENVPEDEYPRFVEVVRFFNGYPEIDQHRVPHQTLDLREDVSDIAVRTIGWWTFPEFGGSYEIITSFAPGKQILNFTLTETTAKALTDEDYIIAELWTETTSEKLKYATVMLESGKHNFTITLFNEKSPQMWEDYRAGLISTKTPVNINNPDLAAAVDVHVVTKRAERARSGEYHTAMVPLKTRYELRVSVNGGRSVVYPINMYRNRALRRNKPVTGQILFPASDVVQLNYAPKIDLPVAEVAKESLMPGSRPSE